jgi:ABC-2 type transport system permease protein
MKSFLSKRNRALLSELVRTDFKLRYQGSALGYAWSILKPLLLFVILYVVFVYFLKIGKDVEHFPVYLLLGIVMWNFFTEMTIQSLSSIINRGDLIRKIKIPRWTIVFSSSISAVINLLLSLVVVVIFMIINGVQVTPYALLFPLNVIMLYFLALGLSYFLAAAFVKFRDLNYIWEVVLQAGFYITPIIYPLTMVPSIILQKILLLNPIAMAIQDARFNLVTQTTVTTEGLLGGLWILIPLAITGLILFVGVSYFKSQSNSFAENV